MNAGRSGRPGPAWLTIAVLVAGLALAWQLRQRQAAENEAAVRQALERQAAQALDGIGQRLRLIEQASPDDLAALQVPLLATSSHAGAPLPHAELPWPCAWVLGHEGQGVAAAVQARCAQTVAIPQPGGEESLNVAAAAAVCLYESARRRQ
ncbi:MAG: hypothetical protein Fur0014_08610 [Rubrivivax sp.]